MNEKYFKKLPVTILVPTFNEERVIVPRIKNLLNLNYPKELYEVIVVDSGSIDNTVNKVKNFLFKYEFETPKISLIQEEKRNGKASAINFGKRCAINEIILVTDANSTFDENVLQEIMPHFNCHYVGAVGGRYCVQNPENSLASSESFYWDLEYIMRKGESIIDSACLFHGEINAWRKHIVNADTQMLSEDLDMCINIRKKGFKIIYEPKALVFEASATNITDQIKQRRRTCIGTIQCLFKHWKYFFHPIDIYSLVIFPSHKSLVLISPFILLIIPILYLLIWDFPVVIIHFLTTIIVFSLLFIALLFLKSKTIINKNSGNKTKKINFKQLFFYVILNEFIILSAWKHFLFGEFSVMWEKAESTR